MTILKDNIKVGDPLQGQVDAISAALDLVIANQQILKEFVQAIAKDVYKEKKIIVPN